MSAGSIRGFKYDGIPYNVAADADIGLEDRIEKESLPHSGGNIIKRTFKSGNGTGITLTLTPSEYDIIKSQAHDTGNKSMSYTLSDGSVMRSEGEIMLGDYQSDSSTCEITAMTSTGEWEVFAES